MSLDPLRRFARLTSSDRMLLVRTGVLVARVRVLLFTRPWPGALRAAHALPFSTGSFPRSHRVSPDRLAWAVRHASRFVPAATCLTQSLALQCALTAQGFSSRIHIGVAKVDGTFRAHAWVEHDGRTLLSTPGEVLQYARSLTLDVTEAESAR
jgi:hypothetical protein